MPAHSKFRSKGTRAKYKWCGSGRLLTIQIVVSTGTDEVFVLCPRMIDEDAQGDVTVEAVYAYISMRRIAVAGVDACGYILAVQKANNTTGEPLEVLNALALDSADASAVLGNRDILQHGLFDVPPVIPIGNAAGKQISDELRINLVTFKARRKLHRLTHGLYLHIVADTSAEVRVFVSARVLLRYS